MKTEDGGSNIMNVYVRCYFSGFYNEDNDRICDKEELEECNIS